MSRSAPARGFTLLELLVVMVIIGLLAGYVGPKFFGQIGKSEVKAAKAQIDALQKSLDQYPAGRRPLPQHRPGSGRAGSQAGRRAQVDRAVPEQGRTQGPLGQRLPVPRAG